jgi:phage host-nuclease inhibitor protein Gam
VHDYSLEINRFIKEIVDLKEKIDILERNENSTIEKSILRYKIQIENLQKLVAKIKKEPKDDSQNIQKLLEKINEQ